MTTRLERLKQAYGQTPERNTERQFNTEYFRFWDMKNGQRAVVRFVSDLNTQNPHGFMIEKVTHKLNINGEDKNVPCMSMYGEECPICALSQKFYKAKDDVNGKKYYKKRQYLAQALIVEDPLPADATTGETNAGKVRTLAINYQIRNLIKEAFTSEDDPLEYDPDDVENGCDFVIKKTPQGDYATYVVGTKFISKPRALNEAELLVVAEGAVDLTTLLPKNPGREKVQAMLDAEVSGSAYVDGPAAPAVAPAAARPTPAPSRPAAAPATTQPAPQTGDDVDEDAEMKAMLEIVRRRRGEIPS